ncbi:MAG: transglycosylase domain-containing protein [Clostridia bacterium]|nr:transglycosylase domain-containing protein [Clostridia bacterium]
MEKKSNDKVRSARKTEQTPYTYSFWSIFTDTFGIILKTLIIVVLLVGVVVGCLGLGMVVGWIQTAEQITAEQLEINTNLTTFIYDNQENVIAKLTGSDNINREQIGYDKIPLVLEHAIVSIEDERFYEHKGFDLIRIAGSVYSLIVNRGEIYQGGSTLTQQVYKNYTDRFEQTFERKIQELYNSIIMEMRWDKKTILTAYANIVNMGNGCYGFQSASKLYFGKDLSEVTLAEAAFLAGIPNAPTLYDPYTEEGYENTITRMKNILDKMLELGYISEETHSEVRGTRVVIKPKEDTIQATATTTYFVDQVISDVIDMLVQEKNVTRSIAELWVYNNGYHIYTTLDSKIQAKMDEVFNDPAYFPTVDSVGDTMNKTAAKYGELPQAAMVIIDQTTGKLLAMYGGGGEKTGSKTLNRATQTFRQPGSSLKPIAIYGPALELELITAATVFDDVPVYLDPKNPDEIYPTNYISGDYVGLVSIRYAIKSSINVVAARVWSELLGRDNSVAFLDRVGIQRGDVIYDDSTVSTATGGLEKGVNPYLMANAFATFANKGVYIKAYTFTEVKNHRDEVVLKVQPKYDTVYRSQTAFILTDILQEVTKTWAPHYHHTGTAFPIVSIQDGLIPVAGKTGTTSDYLDKWFCGYTPYYTGAVWYGYDNRIAPIKLAKGVYRNVDGSYIWDGEYNQALKIWDAVMDKVHEDLAPAEFEKPTTGIVEREICIYSGKVPTDLCYQDPRYPNNTDATIVEYFLEGTEPSYFDTCEVHQTATVCTSSTDPYGRYLLATDDCPPETIMTIVGIVRPEPYVPYIPDPEEKLDEDEIGLYPIITEDMAWDIQVGEYCTVHGMPPDGDPSIIVELDPETGQPLVPTPPPSETPLIP